MKKRIMLLACLLLLLTGCSVPQVNTRIDLASVGSGMEGALASTWTTAATYQGGSDDRPSAQLRPQENLPATMLTQTIEETCYDEMGSTVVFFSQLPKTVFAAPGNSAAEEKIANWLQARLAEEQTAADGYRTMAYTWFSQLQADPELAPFYEYSYYVTDQATRLDEVVLSLVSRTSCYQGGGSPDYSQSAVNFAVDTGEPLSLGDILTDFGKSALCSRVVEQLRERDTEYQLYYGYADQAEALFGPEALADQRDSWYFSEKGLVLFFNPHIIASQYTGAVTIEFSGLDFVELVKKEFHHKAVTDGEIGVLTVGPAEEVIPNGADCTRITVKEGAYRFAISCSQPIYDVVVQNALWAGEQPAVQNVLYRSTWMNPGSAIEIEQDDPRSAESICLRFNPGDGSSCLLRFSEETFDHAVVYYDQEKRNEP